MKKYIIFLALFIVALLFIGAPVRRMYVPKKYCPLLKQYAGRYDIDWLLVSSIVFYESRYRPKVVSPKGAMGLMQVMPATSIESAAKLGLNEFEVDDLFKPKVNLDIGCFYFSRMLKEFDGDILLALAAYNGGKGSVYRWYKKAAGKDNDAELKYSVIYKYVFPETKKYVQRVHGTYRLLKFLDKMWAF